MVDTDYRYSCGCVENHRLCIDAEIIVHKYGYGEMLNRHYLEQLPGGKKLYPNIRIQSLDDEHQILDREWGQEQIIYLGQRYSLKRLFYKAGTKGGLQRHHRKEETFYLESGHAIVRSDDGKGNLTEELMLPGQAYHIPLHATHQFEAITDCIVFEAGDPVMDDRERMEEYYGLPSGTGLLTTTY